MELTTERLSVAAQFGRSLLQDSQTFTHHSPSQLQSIPIECVTRWQLLKNVIADWHSPRRDAKLPRNYL